MPWYCTTDRVTQPEDDLPTRVGWHSDNWPKDLPPDVNLAYRQGRRLWLWRCKDADGNTYYEGVSTVDPERGIWEKVSAPLTQFAGPDAGAVEIQYWLKGQWESM